MCSDMHGGCHSLSDCTFLYKYGYETPYILVNRSVLRNCGIEADNHYLLESIATCDNKDSKLVMYFTINMSFANYLDMFPNLIDSFQLIKDRTSYK